MYLTSRERFEHSCVVVFDRYLDKKYGALSLEVRLALLDSFEKLLLEFEAREEKIAGFFGLVEGADNSERCVKTVEEETFRKTLAGAKNAREALEMFEAQKALIEKAYK